jgi:hypothetical protein
MPTIISKVEGLLARVRLWSWLVTVVVASGLLSWLAQQVAVIAAHGYAAVILTGIAFACLSMLAISAAAIYSVFFGGYGGGWTTPITVPIQTIGRFTQGETISIPLVRSVDTKEGPRWQFGEEMKDGFPVHMIGEGHVYTGRVKFLFQDDVSQYCYFVAQSDKDMSKMPKRPWRTHVLTPLGVGGENTPKRERGVFVSRLRIRSKHGARCSSASSSLSVRAKGQERWGPQKGQSDRAHNRR